jgi:hypothetical protein
MRLILDTNLWSDIGDEGVAAEFDDLVARQGIEVLVPPSILVEVCRLSVRELRDPIVRALATGPRRRLPTEAESESAELVAEIRRAKPHWMRKMPDSARVASLMLSGPGGFGVLHLRTLIASTGTKLVLNTCIKA